MQLAAPFQHTTHSNSTRTTHPGIHTKSALRQVGCFCHYHVNTQHTQHTTTQLDQFNATHTPCQHTTHNNTQQHNNSTQPTQHNTHNNVFIPRASCATLDVSAVNTQQLNLINSAQHTHQSTHAKSFLCQVGCFCCQHITHKTPLK